MALDDIFEYTMRGEYLGQICLNVYYYKQTLASGADAADALRPLFGTVVQPEIEAIQVSEFIWTRQTVQNIRDLTDFTELTISSGGDISTTLQSPPFLTAMFSSSRAGRGTRRGYKRYSGLDGLKVDGNNYTITPSLLASLAAALGQSLTDGLDSFVPVIAKRPIVYGVNPATELAPSWAFQRVTTQNSRKVGALVTS